MAELNTLLQQSAEVVALINEQQALTGRTTPEAMDALAAGSKEAAEQLATAAGHGLAALNALGRGAMDLTKSLYRGEQGMKGMDGALDGIGGAADQAGTALLTLGGPWGILAGIVLKMISVASRKNMKTGRSLSAA